MPTPNFATDYQRALQTRYEHNGLVYTQRLWNSPSNSIIRWQGHSQVRLPVLNILEGMKDRQRRTITTAEVNYENTWETYTLENERYWDTLVDPSDIDETNWTTTIANITRSFNDQQKAPERDKFMMSSLFARKQALGGGAGIHTETLTAENFLPLFDELMTEMDEKGIPAQGREIFCTPPVRTLIKNLQQFGRTLPVQGNTGEINRIINRLDDVVINTAIPSDRMRTMYDFSNGARPVAGSRQIHFILIHIPCMCAPEKYSFVALDEPSAKTAGNWLYYEQVYNDVILFESRHEGLAMVVGPAGS
ncbi:MAG: hypothetical protein FWF59_08465 [Turicibacter sp.]|nr:hypothetical protein [Turicibacter sp.]